MSATEFVDTNVLVYAVDAEAGDKHQKAQQLLRSLSVSGTGAISTQVLQELYVNVTSQKHSFRMGHDLARLLLRSYGSWRTLPIQVRTIFQASHLVGRYGINFWDGLIVAAAEECGATTLWTEDLSHEQRYGSVVARNPFV